MSDLPTTASSDLESPLLLRVLARLRGEHRSFDVRHRQGVMDKRSASVVELHQIAAALHEQSSGPHSHAALACVVGGLIGIHPAHVGFGDLPVDPTQPAQLDAGLCICFSGSATAVDLDLLVEKAAKPSFPGRLRPACRQAVRPLPMFVSKILARQIDGPTRLGSVLGTYSVYRRLPIVDSGRSLRLRSSFARFRNGLAPRLIQLGVDPIVAAIALNDFEACTKSNLAYVTVPYEDILSALQLLYTDLGWGDAAVVPWNMSVGSLTTPTAEAVSRLIGCHHACVRAAQPGRRTSWERLVRHHRAYTNYVVALLMLCGGLRAVVEIRIRCNADGGWFMPITDKVSGEIQIDRPMILVETIQHQLALYWIHCRALIRRLQKLPGEAPHRALRELMQEVETTNSCPLAWLDSVRGSMRPVGWQAAFDGIPPDVFLPTDFGRHWLATLLYEHGHANAEIDIALRHAVVGTESMSSTSRSSLAAAFRNVAKTVEAELRKRRISPLPGIATR